MENVTFVEVELSTGVTETYAYIDRGNGEFTSMRKSVWDELEAAKEASGTLS